MFPHQKESDFPTITITITTHLSKPTLTSTRSAGLADELVILQGEAVAEGGGREAGEISGETQFHDQLLLKIVRFCSFMHWHASCFFIVSIIMCYK